MPITFEPVIACVQVAIKAQDNVYQSQMYNVLHFQCPSAQPTLGDVLSVLSFVDTWVNGVYRQNFSSDFTVVELRGRSLYQAVAPFDFRTVSYQGQQGGSDEYAHAPLMLIHGGLTQRTQAGRFYSFPPGIGGIAQAGYPPIVYTNLTNALLNLAANAHLNGYELGIASRKDGVCYLAQSIGHSNRLTLQKRRRPSFGR